MARGTKPLPTAMKILKGTQPCRINHDEPKAPLGSPECPIELDKDGRFEWERITAELEGIGILSLIDRSALTLYCEAYSTWVKARRKVRSKGMLLDTAAGGLKPNPAVLISERARAEMRRILSEFGCTPASRSQVRADKTKQKDALGDFLNRKAE